MTCRSWQSEDDLVIKEEQNEYSYELTGKRVLGKAAAVILTATALFWLPDWFYCRGKSQIPFWYETKADRRTQKVHNNC